MYENLRANKRVVNCESTTGLTLGKSVSAKDKERCQVRRSVEQILEARELKKQWGDLV